jgi:hypothetical protein
MTLEKHEHIVKVDGQTDGKYVNQLIFTTDGSSSGRKVYGPFGKNGSLPFSFEDYIVAFFGGHGSLHLNSIGVYSMVFLRKSGGALGGAGGSPFNDNGVLLSPPAPQFVGISQIKIWSGKVVEAIQVTYAFLGFDFFIADQHGVQSGGNMTTIDIADEEILEALEGLIEDDYISQLTFIVQKPGGTKVKYGPFGETGERPFGFDTNIIAFYGTSGSRINQIGIYYV